MKEITLTSGSKVKVDDADFEWLNQWNWSERKSCNTSYARRIEWVKGGKGKTIRHDMHRLIMGVNNSKILIDHKDRDGLNNQRYNLRESDKSKNAQNGLPHSDNKYSMFRGVTFDINRKKWISTICKNNKRYPLGRFDSEKEAALAYNKKATDLHGEFANLNIIGS